MNGRRNQYLIAASVCVGIAAGLCVLRPSEVTGNATPAIEEFAVVWENNIFDPARRPGVESIGETSLAPPPAPDSLTLLGTMLSPAERRAIFGGSQPAFHSAAVEGDAIADFALVSVRIDGVHMQRNGKEVFLPVGMAINIQATGEWDVGEISSAPPADAAAPHSDADAGATGDSDNSPANSDVLEALRQRRKKELKR